MLEVHLETYQQQGGGYNEVVVGGRDWNERLPAAVAAFVYGPDADADEARSLHNSFLRRFGRTACETPLLWMDLGLAAPFRGDVAC